MSHFDNQADMDMYEEYGLYRLDAKKVPADLIASMEIEIESKVEELRKRWTDEYHSMRASGQYDRDWLRNQHRKDMAFLPAMARSFQHAFLEKHQLLNYQQ